MCFAAVVVSHGRYDAQILESIADGASRIRAGDAAAARELCAVQQYQEYVQLVLCKYRLASHSLRVSTNNIPPVSASISPARRTNPPAAGGRLLGPLRACRGLAGQSTSPARRRTGSTAT
jgi:hypothetical protein